MNGTWVYFLVLVPCALVAGVAVYMNLKNNSVRKEEEPKEGTLLNTNGSLDSQSPEPEKEETPIEPPKEEMFYEDPTVVSLKTARVEKLFKERTPNEKVMVKQLIKLGLHDPRSIDHFLNTVQSETAKEVPAGEPVHNRRSTDKKSRSDTHSPTTDHGSTMVSTGYTPSPSSGGHSGGGGCSSGSSSSPSDSGGGGGGCD